MNTCGNTGYMPLILANSLYFCANAFKIVVLQTTHVLHKIALATKKTP